MDPDKEFKIIETPCWPCYLKVVHAHGSTDNATFRYHRTRESALKQIGQFKGTLVR